MKQQRICDCWLDVGGCFCELNTLKDERERTDSDEKQGEESRGSSAGTAGADVKPKRPLGWDARDIKTYGWVQPSPRSTEGRYEDRFFQDE